MRTQQKTLRQRSRRFSVTEEDSREDLRTLREEIQRLQEQLELLDIQKVEEHAHLSNKIKELVKKEHELKHDLQKISHQKGIAEEELEHTIQEFREMAESHEKEKAHYEQQIEYLQHKQSDMEIRIAHLLDEQQGNERSLQQEIEILKLSKAELEEKVAEMRQQHPEQRQEAENELLEVIERQESVIQQLKERAHQRSVMLREENETLKKEVEHMQTRQEKIHWENQMLESSLKSLQHDLAEYLLLKNKFEEAQREKEHFEDAFYRKIRFLEQQYMAEEGSYEPVQTRHHINIRLPKERVVREEPIEETPVFQATSDTEKTKRIPLRAFWPILPKILIPIGVILAILAVALVTVKLLELKRSSQLSSETPADMPASAFELPEDKFGLHRALEPGIVQDATDVLPLEPEPTQEHTAVEVQETSHAQPLSAPSSQIQQRVVQNQEPKPQQLVASITRQPQKSLDIIVQLSSTERAKFLPKEQQPFPTAENNVVVRRYYEKKHTIIQ